MKRYPTPSSSPSETAEPAIPIADRHTAATAGPKPQEIPRSEPVLDEPEQDLAEVGSDRRNRKQHEQLAFRQFERPVEFRPERLDEHRHGVHQGVHQGQTEDRKIARQERLTLWTTKFRNPRAPGRPVCTFALTFVGKEDEDQQTQATQ